MARSSRRDYWQGVLARQASSGLSIKAFCERERVSYQSFFFWKRQLRNQPVRATGEMTFAPVTVVAPAQTVACGIEIVLLGDCRVVVHAPVDRQALSDVLAVLRAGEVAAC